MGERPVISGGPVRFAGHRVVANVNRVRLDQA
jgi:hypothetical protein